MAFFETYPPSVVPAAVVLAVSILVGGPALTLVVALAFVLGYLARFLDKFHHSA